MHPVLIDLGFIEIRFYGLMYVVAILVGSYLIKSEVKRKGVALTDEGVMNFIMWMVVGGVVGARLYYVLFNWGFYSAHLIEIPAVWHGGLAIHGGILGGALFAYVFLKRKGVSFWKMADVVAPAGILGQAFGRFGNFMNGDAHGRPTDMPWGIVFPPSSIAGAEFPGSPLHPAMLYEMVFNFSIFCLLWFGVKNGEHRNGLVFALYVGLYSTGRLVIEHFRADSLMLGPLKAAQVVSIIVIVVAAGAIISGKLWRPPASA